MLLGEEIRLKHLLSDPSGKYLGITVDHAMARGVLPGLDHIDQLIEQIVKGKPDALTMHKGLAEYCFHKYAGKVPLVVKCTTFSPVHPKKDVPVCSVEEAIALGADAISVGAILLGEHQESQIETLSTLSGQAHKFGMPVLAHIYPRGLENPNEWHKAENIKYAVRTGAELGVNLVKTMYTGDIDSFATVVQATPAKVAVAGGDAGLHSVAECLQLARDVIDAGGVGITFGRCIFQYEQPANLIKALAKVIHENYNVKDALDYLDEINQQ